MTVSVGEAVKSTCLLGCSDKGPKVADILRQDIFDAYHAQDELSWPPVVESLVDKGVVITKQLVKFLRALFMNVNSTKVDHLVCSLGQDLC